MEQISQLEEQLQELQRDIKRLETKRHEAEIARVKLKGFQVQRSRFYRNTGQFSRGEPVIELTVKNTLDVAVARAYFRGILATPGRAIPWVDDEFNYVIRGGLESGEEATWHLSPNMFSDWGHAPRDRQDMVLTVEVTRVDGADDKSIFDSEFNADDQSRLESSYTAYAEIRQQLDSLKPPPAANN